MKTYYALVISIVSFLAITDQFAAALVAEDAKYQAESACVMKYIPKGIERRDIQTGNGTCWIVR